MIKKELRHEIGQSKQTNKMIIDRQKRSQMERLKNFELRYEEANFAQMGLAAYNINDYPTAVFYLEEALQRGTTYQAGGLNGEAVELLEGRDRH